MNDYARAYRHKIKEVDGLLEVIGTRPRAKKVIMCHGAFDLVHPGHLRHLMFAKEKADILVASLTSDAHISKANARPYVPQALRAVNLAALDMVDYVLVDPNPTPIENITKLQPDYFAKGYEYSAEGLPEKTREEMATVEAYGGEMVFTPGDIIYSSSAIIESGPPKIRIEKLLTLMDSEGLSFGEVRQTISALGKLRVHVVGDTIVDSYSYCSLLGAAPKSPTFSVKHDVTERFSGGAAVVAKHLRAAGAQVSFSTVLGEDELKDFVLDDLAAADIECHAVVDRTRPTTHKERFIADNYKMLQVDRVDSHPVSARVLNELAESTGATDADVVIFSDFRHGIFNRDSVSRLRKGIPDRALKVADSQVSNRWGNILDFVEFDLLTPNEREVRFALGDQDSVVRPLALELFKRARCHELVLKLGERGILAYRNPGPEPREFFALDSFVDNLVDPIGAGDAFLSYASLARAVSGNIVTAAILGSLGAAIACERQGNNPVLARDVERKLRRVEEEACYG